MEYDGNGRKILEIKDLVNPSSVDIIDAQLFWTERGDGAIKKIRLDNLNHTEVVKKSLGSNLKSLRIFSSKKQYGSNSCARSDCEEICLFDGLKAKCYCSHGYPDPKDQRKCKRFDNLMFFSKKDSIEKHHVNSENGSVTNDSIKNEQYLQNAVALASDFRNRLIFFSDLKLNGIFSCTFDGTNFKKLLDRQSTVEGIVFNPQDNKLYWTLNSDAEIRSVDLNLWKNGTILNDVIVKSITTLLKLKKGVDKLRAIAVEPCLAMLYYSNWNAADPSISRIYTSGYGREKLISKDIFMPNALSLDYIDKKVFWADARLDKIERCDYDGNNRVVLANISPKHPFSIAVLGNYIFWTDWMLHGVLQANKYSGNDVSFVKRDIEQPMGLFIAIEPIKSCTSNECLAFNAGCEDICMPHGSGHKCECSQGVLGKDGKRCISRDRMVTCDPVNEFQCKSGECVPYFVTCDGIMHCSDSSDESLSFCATRKCPEEVFFQCRNFRCIFKNETCDGHSNCEDGSDEDNCTCTSDQFTCKNGECIAADHKCDFEPDCKDASDEMGCESRDCSAVASDFGDSGFKPVQTHRLIPCPNTTACYMKEWECDGDFLLF